MHSGAYVVHEACLYTLQQYCACVIDVVLFPLQFSSIKRTRLFDIPAVAFRPY